MKSANIEELRSRLGVGLLIGASGLILAAVAACLVLRSTLGEWMPWAAAVSAVFGVTVSFLGLRYKENANRLLNRLENRDHLTGLWNGKQLFEDYRALENKEGHVFVMVQVNDVHMVTDLFGNRAAEDIIKRLGLGVERFASSHEGRAYRLELDLFGFLLPVRNQKDFLSELKQLLSDLEKVTVRDRYVDYSVHYTFTYGVYFMNESENAMDDLEKIANLTFHAVRRMSEYRTTQGTVFTPETKPDWERFHTLCSEVREAWKNREFVPYYQLIYRMDTGRAVGAELLTRWQHPTMGLLMPSEFLPVMEAEGLIMDLDLYMLEEACKQIKKWIDNELVTVPLSVNISKLNIHRKDFVKRVISTVQSYDIPPELIELELTESIVLYESNGEFLELVGQLREFGFSLSMDDFAATEMSSINLLRSIPVNVVKVSRKFFHNVETSERECLFVEHILKMAKQMKIKLIAMGIETEEQVDLIKRLGCGYAQGFYFARPMSNEEFEHQMF